VYTVGQGWAGGWSQYGHGLVIYVGERFAVCFIGYCATGGGGGLGSGGGGSSYATTNASTVTHTQGINYGNGQIIISW